MNPSKIIEAPEPGPDNRQPPDHLEGLIDEAIEESFPASDPPAVPVRREPASPTPAAAEPGRQATEQPARGVRPLPRGERPV